MSKRTLCFNWCALQGARKKKRKLHLERDDNGIFICPISCCLHVGFKSERGVRKHINSKHEWFFYFDSQPEVKREEAQNQQPEKRKASTHKQLAFSIDNGCGFDFVQWLQTPCGGGKKLKEAKQAAKRGMKFLMYSMGDSEDGVTAEESFIDCAVGSPTMLMKFLKLLLEEWRLKAAGTLSYLQAITDLCDFRKCHGVSDSVLRMFAVTEVYLRRSKSTLYRKRNVEYSRNLNLEALIAEESWATLEDMEKVIPHHSPKYQELFRKAGSNNQLAVSELAFATRFLITFLLLRVKCTRPMSLQYLTVDMITLANKNGGFVDQTQFKTTDQYGFDSLMFSEDALDVVNTYIKVIRPLCKPKCEYVILTTAGTQYTAFCNALSLLTLEAIGKHITPTRYRAIVESESVERLPKDKQLIISHDQKHTNVVARKHYQKKLSREVAEEGAAAMRELVGTERDKHTEVLASDLRDSLETSADNSNDGEAQSASRNNVEPEDKPGSATVVIEDCTAATILIDDVADLPEKTTEDASTSKVIESDNIEVKKEELEQGKKFLSFSTEEDDFLKIGFVKHSASRRKWSDILNDGDFKFQEGRSRDSLRVRATTLGLEKGKTKRKARSK